MIRKIIVIIIGMLLIITAISATGSKNVHSLGYVKENKDLETYQSYPTKSSDIITIKIDGEVTGIVDTNNLLEGKIQVNDGITGEYIYDSGTPDSEPDPSWGVYEYYSPPSGIRLEAGGFFFKTDPNDVFFSIDIFNDAYYYDIYGLTSYNNSLLSNGLIVYSIELAFIDSTGNALSNDSLPITAPVLSDWEDKLLLITGHSPSNPDDIYLVGANITNATLSKNEPPNAPTITGQTGGKPGEEYEYTFNSTDPDGDTIRYYVNWGDDDTGWTEYSDSDEEITLKHTWSEDGTYNITAKTQDINGAESGWSEFTVEIEKSRNRETVYSLFLQLFERFPLLERLLNLLIN